MQPSQINNGKGTALDGLKVLEWGNDISAPFCAKLMADLGAMVIKIEKPVDGDNARRHGPFPQNKEDLEKSGLFLNLNTNKFGITLDLLQSEGRKIFKNLIKHVDVLVENNSPQQVEELGLSYAVLSQINPSLIMTSITPYGQTGPYRDYKAYDVNISAIGGISCSIGYPDREPMPLPFSQSHYQAGLNGAIATMLAVLHRDNSGKGQYIDVSEAESWTTFHTGLAVLPFITHGNIRGRSGFRVMHAPYVDAVLPVKDGFVCIDTPQNKQWERLLELLGNPEWSKSPIFKNRIRTTDEYGDEADALWASWLADKSKEEVFKLCQDNRIPCGPVYTMEETVNNRHLNARGFFVEIEHPATGNLKYPGAPYRFSKTPWRVRRPAPLLGQHNVEVYRDLLKYNQEELTAWQKNGVI